MYVIRVNDNEPKAIALNLGLRSAVEAYGQALIQNPDANEVALLEVSVEHAKPVLKRVLGSYRKDGI